MKLLTFAVFFTVPTLLAETQLSAKEPDLKKATMGILKEATKVEAFRLDPEAKIKPNAATIGSEKMKFLIQETAKPKGKELAAKIRDLLLNPRTRQQGSDNKFKPTVAFRLSRPNKASVTLLMDLKGYNFHILTHDNKGKEVEANRGGIFDINGELPLIALTLVEEAFPDFPNPWEIRHPELKDATKAILKKATQVEVFQIKRLRGNNANVPLLEMGKLKFEITKKSAPQGKKFAASLGKILLDPSTRKPSGAGGFNPTLAFRISSGGKASVTVAAYLEGFSLVLYSVDGKGKVIEQNSCGLLFGPNAGKKNGFDTQLAEDAFDLVRQVFPKMPSPWGNE